MTPPRISAPAASDPHAHFEPKLVTVLREGYSARQLWHDVLAGLQVGVVALPLSIALAIASGVRPEQGLYTAIVAGFLISLFGGSRVLVAPGAVRSHRRDPLSGLRRDGRARDRRVGDVTDPVRARF